MFPTLGFAPQDLEFFYQIFGSWLSSDLFLYLSCNNFIENTIFIGIG